MEPPKLAFSFSKVIPKKTVISAPKVDLGAEVKKETVKEIVLSIDETGIQTNKPLETKEPLVIPCITNNNWRLNKRLKEEPEPQDKPVIKHPIEPQELSIDDLARKELLSE